MGEKLITHDSHFSQRERLTLVEQASDIPGMGGFLIHPLSIPSHLASVKVSEGYMVGTNHQGLTIIEPKVIHLQGIMVDKSLRRQGIGKELITAAIDESRRKVDKSGRRKYWFGRTEIHNPWIVDALGELQEEGKIGAFRFFEPMDIAEARNATSAELLLQAKQMNASDARDLLSATAQTEGNFSPDAVDCLFTLA